MRNWSQPSLNHETVVLAMESLTSGTLHLRKPVSDFPRLMVLIQCPAWCQSWPLAAAMKIWTKKLEKNQ